MWKIRKFGFSMNINASSFLKSQWKLINNAGYLALFQVVNVITQLVAVPLQLSAIGIEEYGKLSAYLASVGLLIAINDYGFAMSGPIEVAKRSSKTNEVSAYVSQVIVAKFLLMLPIGITTSLMLLLVDSTFIDLKYSLSLVVFYLGMITSPLFISQGLQQLAFTVGALAAAKIAWVAFLFVFLKSAHDSFLIPLMLGLFLIISNALIFNRFLRSGYNIKFNKENIDMALNVIRADFSIFAAVIISRAYTSLSVIIVSFLFGYRVAGIYSFAEKICNVALLGNQAIIGALSPIISSISRVNKPVFVKSSKKYLWMIFTSGITFMIGTFWILEVAISLLLQEELNSSELLIVYLLIITIPVYSINALLANMLIILEKQKNIGIITFESLIVFLATLFIFSEMGPAVVSTSVLLSQAYGFLRYWKFFSSGVTKWSGA